MFNVFLKVFSSNFIVLVLKLVSGFLFPKWMTTSEYASYQLFLLYISYIGILHLGFPTGMYINYAGIPYVEIEKKHFKKEIEILVAILLFFSCVFVVAFFITQNLLVFEVGICILPYCFVTSFQSLYQAWGDFGTFSKLNILLSAVPIVVALAISAVTKVFYSINYVIAFEIAYLIAFVQIFYSIIVDNCSPDGSYEKLKRMASSKIDVIKTTSNKGYAAGNNEGIRFVLNKYGDCDVVVISNPDIRISQESFSTIISTFGKDSEQFAATGEVYNLSGKRISLFTWKIPTYGMLLTQNCTVLRVLLARLDCLIGARMHATIAALSSETAVVPFAYSRKFNGLFQTLDYPYVIDGTELSTEDALAKTQEFILQENRLRERAIEANAFAQEKLEQFKDSLASNLLGEAKNGRN